MSNETGLRIFVRTKKIEKVDYATAFALACDPFFDMENLEERFDFYWDRYEMRPLQD